MKRIYLFLMLALLFIFAGCCTDRLSYWKKGSWPRVTIEDAVTTIKNTVPRDNWIAVFDFDGTLFCERDRTYFNWWCAARYIVDHPSKFTESDIAVAQKVLSDGAIPGWSDQAHGLGDGAFVGLTVDKYMRWIDEYANEDMPSFNNLKRRDAFYLPMLQLISYLQDEGFRVFICTGTERRLVRTLIKGKIDIPDSNVIGSSYDLAAVDGKMVITNTVTSFNINETKVINIENEIGTRPALIFGNSSSDYQMGTFFNAMPRLTNVFMVCGDDNTRDVANVPEATAVWNECRAKGWCPISIRHHWTAVYGPDVRKRVPPNFVK